jgi:hypothetical protein
MAKYMLYAGVAVAQPVIAVAGTRLQKNNTKLKKMNTT